MSDAQEFATQDSVNAVAQESAPVEQAAEVTQVEEVVEAQPETPVGNPEEQGSEPPKAVRELIEQRKKRQRAEQEAAYWRGMAEARGPQSQPQAVPAPAAPAGPPVAPSLDSFETYDEYEKAREDYLIAAAEHRIAQKFAQQQRVQQQQSLAQTFEQRMTEAAKADPTIVEIRNDPTLPVSQVMAQLLQRSEMAPQLLKWLNNNREDAARMVRMDPISVAMAMGRAEAEIKATPKPAPPKKVSAAPAPIQTVQATSPAEIDEDDLPMAEYYKRRTKQMLGR